MASQIHRVGVMDMRNVGTPVPPMPVPYWSEAFNMSLRIMICVPLKSIAPNAINSAV